jgi:hypothetical protein
MSRPFAPFKPTRAEFIDMKRFGVAAVACALALWSGVPAAVAQDAAVEQVRRPAPRYFIDFRSRSALSYGHTFVVFGRIGEKLTAKNVAGLHPKGDSSIVYMLGHVLPVPSETGASDGDLEEQYTTARYRIMLNAAEYRAVVAHIRELQANSPAWNAATYNCNAFAGTIAHFVGLVTPPTWLLPEDFINSMRRMNDERRRAAVPQPPASRGGAPTAMWGADRRDEAGRAMARQARMP